MHTIKPINKEIILQAIEEMQKIITVEDHNIIGGLGSAVSEVIAEYGKSLKFQRNWPERLLFHRIRKL